VKWAVRIKGRYSVLVIEYQSFDDACAGAERARRKIAFINSDVEVIEK